MINSWAGVLFHRCFDTFCLAAYSQPNLASPAWRDPPTVAGLEPWTKFRDVVPIAKRSPKSMHTCVPFSDWIGWTPSSSSRPKHAKSLLWGVFPMLGLFSFLAVGVSQLCAVSPCWAMEQNLVFAQKPENNFSMQATYSKLRINLPIPFEQLARWSNTVYVKARRPACVHLQLSKWGSPVPCVVLCIPGTYVTFGTHGFNCCASWFVSASSSWFLYYKG